MRKLWLLLLFTLVVPLGAHAQSAEVFGGYSYLRLDPSGTNMNGWNASLTAKPMSWLGLTADFAGQYGSPGGVSSKLYTFMFGPQLSFPAPVSPFAHVLFGAARFSVAGLSDTAFAAAIGGGFDIKALPHISYRLVQLDEVFTRFGNTTQHNFRFSTGIVIRF